MDTVSNNTSNQGDNAITATRVPDAQRLDFLPRHFGRHMMHIENYFYTRCATLLEGYSGGYWQFYDLSNGGCFMAMEGDPMTFFNADSGVRATLSADGAGIIVMLYVLSELSFRHASDETFGLLLGDRFHQLRAYAATHSDHEMIFNAID